MFSRLLLSLGVGVGLPQLAHAVPNFDIGPGGALLILLMLFLSIIGIPALIGLLVRWVLVRSGKVPRAGFVLPIFLACLGWLLGFLLNASLSRLLGQLPAALTLLWMLLPLATSAGAAAMGVYIRDN